MKVYVLEVGEYEARGVEGVYATPELAMAAWQPTRPLPHVSYIISGNEIADATPQATSRARIFDAATGETQDAPPPPPPPSYTWKSSREGVWSFDGYDSATITEYEVVAAERTQLP